MADDFGDSPSDQSIGNLSTAPIGGGISTSGHIDLKGGLPDFDFFKVQLTAGVTYRITMDGAASGFTLGDPFLSLQTAGQHITSDNDSGIGNNSYILFMPATTGTYYVDAHSAVAFATGTYQLSIFSLNPF